MRNSPAPVKGKSRREIDALAAEKLLGWRWMVWTNPATGFDGDLAVLVQPDRAKHRAYRPDDGSFTKAPPDAPLLTTDIAAAWMLVDALQAKRFSVTVAAVQKYQIGCRVVGLLVGDDIWTTGRNNSVVAEAIADTTPLAITLAALKTVGIDVEVARD